MSTVAGCPLDGSVLVLNKFYHGRSRHFGSAGVLPAVQGTGRGHHDRRRSICGFQFLLLARSFPGRALFKEPDDEFVRTVQFEIQVPRIIRLLTYDRFPRQKVKFNRRNLFARDGNRCQYCARKFATSALSLDHVVPRSQGGKASWDNIVCACLKCNVRKGGRTPREAGMRLYREPVEPRTSPSLRLKLSHRKYRSWKTFLDNAYWSVELE